MPSQDRVSQDMSPQIAEPARPRLPPRDLVSQDIMSPQIAESGERDYRNSQPPDRMLRISPAPLLSSSLTQDRKPILPSLPVKNSVLQQLGIADHEFPHGLARLKHNLLLSPPLGYSPGLISNPLVSRFDKKQWINYKCTNSELFGFGKINSKWVPQFQKRLYDTIGESPIARRGPDPDPDIDYESQENTFRFNQLDIEDYDNKKNTFHSMSYLDQIAFVCLASGLYACQEPGCLQYRRKLERVAPVCDSWPGLRDWVLCILSCSLRVVRQVNLGRTWGVQKEDEESKNGLVPCRMSHSIVDRCLAHLGACILLTIPFEALEQPDWISCNLTRDWDPKSETLEQTGSIGGPRPDQTIYSFEKAYAHKPRPRPPPVPRPSIYMQTFDPLQKGSAEGPSVDVAEVLQLVAWFLRITNYDVGGNNTPWYNRDFIPVASKAITEASGKISKLGFCQRRVWEVVRNSAGGVFELVPLVRALEDLPQLRHDKHKSCTSKDGHPSCAFGDDHKSCTPGDNHESCNTGYCENSTLNFTSVTQLHKCLDHNCKTTTDEMFDQSHLVKALEGHTMTTAWTLDGKSLVAQGKSYLAVSHVWSDGTGVGAWKAGQVNKCLWDFFTEQASSLGCDGVWWDTVCIPQDKAARSTAINNMHCNYAAAEYTMVHDLYLAGIEWKSDGSPCIALVLSPWFTRGWTALELLLSKRVFILFRQGDGYTLKDLDNEVLAQHHILHSHAHWIATDAVKRLRQANSTFKSTSELLSVLQARHTSWSRDQSIIAGLMCGLTDHAALSEQVITKQILIKMKRISGNCLLHGLPTMSDSNFSWCPPRFIDIPAGRPSNILEVGCDGTLSGVWEIWYIPSKTIVDRGLILPLSTDIGVRTQVQWALQEPDNCVILTTDRSDSQGLLVRLKAYTDRLQDDILYCKYIGAVNVSPSEIRKPRFRIMREVVIGYAPGMVDVGVVDWEQNDKDYKLHKKGDKDELYQAMCTYNFK